MKYVWGQPLSLIIDYLKNYEKSPVNVWGQYTENGYCL